jgi:hypothetical protein
MAELWSATKSRVLKLGKNPFGSDLHILCIIDCVKNAKPFKFSPKIENLKSPWTIFHPLICFKFYMKQIRQWYITSANTESTFQSLNKKVVLQSDGYLTKILISFMQFFFFYYRIFVESKSDQDTIFFRSQHVFRHQDRPNWLMSYFLCLMLQVLWMELIINAYNIFWKSFEFLVHSAGTEDDAGKLWKLGKPLFF